MRCRLCIGGPRHTLSEMHCTSPGAMGWQRLGWITVRQPACRLINHRRPSPTSHFTSHIYTCLSSHKHCVRLPHATGPSMSSLLTCCRCCNTSTVPSTKPVLW